MSAELYELIDELRATANRGLAWSGNDHDRQRYEKVLAAAARLGEGGNDHRRYLDRNGAGNDRTVCISIGDLVDGVLVHRTQPTAKRDHVGHRGVALRQAAGLPRTAGHQADAG